MSDPVKNEEIEDVLSSIRRLVSESGGLQENTKEPQEAPISASSAEPDVGALPEEQSGTRTDRLVLTPSLRVADDMDAPAGDLRSDTEGTAEERFAEPDNEGSIEEAGTADGAREDSQDADVSEEEHDVAHGAAEIFESAEREDAEPEKADLENDPSAEVEDRPDQPQDGESADGAETSEEPPAQAEADEQHTGEDNTGEHTSGAEQAGETLKDRIEQLETAVLHSASDWEDDMEGGGDNAPHPVETLQWEDHRDDEAPGGGRESARASAYVRVAEPSREDEGEDSSDEFDFMGDDDEAVLDEDALREMVADIVRQELQGALGERITRNVRKLVRREIHRALMAQELD